MSKPPPHLAASDPLTPPNRLARLAKKGSRSEQSEVASNPNTPLDALLHLAPLFPVKVAQNPSFELALLCDPTLLATLQEAAAIAFASSPEVPSHLLSELARRTTDPYRDATFLHHLLTNPTMPLDALRFLVERALDEITADELHAFIADALAPDPRTPPDLLARFARIPAPAAEMIEALALHPAFPSDDFSLLYAAFPERAGRVLAEHPATPPDLLVSLTGARTPEIRGLARKHPSLPASWAALLDRLGFAPELSATSAPPFDHPIDVDDMESLYHGGWWFRLYLARHPATPAALLARLRTETDPMLRRLLDRRAA